MELVDFTYFVLLSAALAFAVADSCLNVPSVIYDSEPSIEPIARIACRPEKPCPSGLACVDGKCDCAVADFQDLKSNCGTQVPGPCTTDSECVAHAFCKPIDDDDPLNGHCSCDPGYLPYFGLCKLDNGGTCTRSSECFGYLDSNNPVKCIDFKCECDAFAEWYPQQGCRILVGGPCNATRPCIDHASCVDPAGVPPVENSKYCLCDAGFEETRDYTCEQSNI